MTKISQHFSNKNSKNKHLPSIFNVPLCMTSKRFFTCNEAPSLDHLISGVGDPPARHKNVATLPFGSVWFVGPIFIIGGGMSSTEFTYK